MANLTCEFKNDSILKINSVFNLKRKYRRVVQIELNEISKKVIDKMILQGKLAHFAQMNQEWSFYETFSENQYENWEPWIQWVTAHTGKTLAEHGIFRLSDVHQLKNKQIFETLSEYEIESAIVGSMNVIRGNSKGGFFFPDPWSKICQVYPANLEPLWRLLNKNTQKRDASLLSTELVKVLQICTQFKLPLELYIKIAIQLISQKFEPLTKWKLASFLDLFLAEIFQQLLRSNNFGFYTLFLNSVAHYQHHYWRNFTKDYFDPSIQCPDCREFDDPMTYGYQLYDKILGKILKLANQPDTLIIVASGLSQVPFSRKESEGGMNYYRLQNHQKFTQYLGFSDLEVYPMMSRDWQIKIHNKTKLEEVKKTLNGLKVLGEPLFKVVQNLPNCLFIETAVTKRINDNADIINHQGKCIAKFKNTFENIGIKSGHHNGIGYLWISEKPSKDLPRRVPLTSLYNLTLQALV